MVNGDALQQKTIDQIPPTLGGTTATPVSVVVVWPAPSLGTLAAQAVTRAVQEGEHGAVVTMAAMEAAVAAAAVVIATTAVAAATTTVAAVLETVAVLVAAAVAAVTTAAMASDLPEPLLFWTPFSPTQGDCPTAFSRLPPSAQTSPYRSFKSSSTP